MYQIEYFCPRESPNWQILTEGWIWKTPREFASLQEARHVCDSLIWRYHASRVVDPAGRIVYQ
jgi:hypothetical protein